MFCTQFPELITSEQLKKKKSPPFNFKFCLFEGYVTPNLLNRLLSVILYKVNERWLTVETVRVYFNICAKNMFACY